MAEKTPRLNLDTYAQGDGDWSHNDTVEALDELAIDRGPSSSRPTSGDYDHQMFYELDQRILWRWDAESSDWARAKRPRVESARSTTRPAESASASKHRPR